MSPATRANRMPVALYRAAGPAGKSGSRLRSASRASRTAPGPDFAARLRGVQRELRRRLERRDTLLDLMRAVNNTLDPAKIADALIERTSSWLPAPCWAVVLVDQSGRLSVLADRGVVSAMAPAPETIATWVMNRGQELASADLRRDTRVTHAEVGAALALPLVCRGRRVGALVAFDSAPATRAPQLTATTLRAVRVLLEPAAVALDNALRVKHTEALSVTDDLTQLYNSRYLNQVLRRETKRASRSGRPLSLLFVDLDGFKSVNDRHGHLCGSRALVEAAAVIRRSARETDMVSRFGGDEFALVLPETGGEGAFAVGERIREKIAAHKFLAGEGLDIHLTVSVGVATLPDVATSSEELVQAADKAMYQVKDSGKNGIQAAIVPADN